MESIFGNLRDIRTFNREEQEGKVFWRRSLMEKNRLDEALLPVGGNSDRHLPTCPARSYRLQHLIKKRILPNQL